MEFRNFTYLLVEFVAFFFPFMFSQTRWWPFAKEWRSFVPAMFITAMLFIIWDMIFTNLGIWSFNYDYLTGIRIYNLPLEEVLFFLFIPYACIFSYYCVGLYKGKTLRKKDWRNVSLALVLGLILIGVVYIQRLHTAITSFALAGFIFYISMIKNYNWVNQYLLSFAFVLIPFFIVNGILTGTFLDDAVFKYHPEHIINFRLGTIPVEDAFYGMLLMGINIYLYEAFRRTSFAKNKNNIGQLKLQSFYNR